MDEPGKRCNRKAWRAARTRTVQVGRLGGYYDLKYYRSCDHLIGNTPDIVRYLVEEGCWKGTGRQGNV